MICEGCKEQMTEDTMGDYDVPHGVETVYECETPGCQGEDEPICESCGLNRFEYFAGQENPPEFDWDDDFCALCPSCMERQESVA